MTQRSKKLLDQVHACPEPTEGMQFGSLAVAGQCKNHDYSTEKTYRLLRPVHRVQCASQQIAQLVQLCRCAATHL